MIDWSIAVDKNFEIILKDLNRFKLKTDFFRLQLSTIFSFWDKKITEQKLS